MALVDGRAVGAATWQRADVHVVAVELAVDVAEVAVTEEPDVAERRDDAGAQEAAEALRQPE